MTNTVFTRRLTMHKSNSNQYIYIYIYKLPKITSTEIKMIAF